MTEKLVATEKVTPGTELVMIENPNFGFFETILVTADEKRMIDEERAKADEKERIKLQQLLAEADLPATAEQTEATAIVHTVSAAEDFLALPDEYDVPTFLTAFERKIRQAILDKEFKFLKPYTESKSVILRSITEQMVAEHGKFNFEGLIPYTEACIHCNGLGEKYKFFRETKDEDCKDCTGPEHKDAGKGYLFIKCRSCGGKKVYTKGKTPKPCTRCYKDERGKPTGVERVRCRQCRGTSIFTKMVIAPKIKSTTHCHHCKGRGFVLPEPEKERETPARIVSPANPVITEDLAAKIKSANTDE